MQTWARMGVALFMLLVLGASLPAAAEAPEDAVRQALSRVMPNARPDHITASPVKGLYEVRYGPRLFYVSADGRFLVEGDIYNLQTREDLTEPRLRDARAKTLSSLGKDREIVFAPAKPADKAHTVTVFTDVDCPYCQLLHSKMKEYNDLGIEVRYLLFPRAPAGTPTYQRAETVWCSKDRAAALTQAKSGGALSPLTCKNPLQANVMLGHMMGVTGTPTIVTSSGRVISGYVPPKQLLQALNGAQ